MLKNPMLGAATLQRGLSLIEMMVGITIGMIVVAGASLMMTNQVTEHRRLLLETQVQQDLRATADLMLRDLRRAGFWATPQAGAWSPDATNPVTNVYSGTTPAVTTQDGTQVLYSYSRADNYNIPAGEPAGAPEDNALGANEQFGFRIRGGVLQSLLVGTWQPLTDPDTLTVTGFTVDLNVQSLSLSDYCSTPCPASNPNCTAQQIRRFNIVITGQAKHDANVVRTVNVSSRLRNDRIVGSCPA